MGTIIDTKNAPNNTVICKLLLSNHEIEDLRGHMKNIHLFSAKMCNKETKINTRGNKGVTKYFKIPLSIRSRKKHNWSLTYQKIEDFSKIFYIYTLKTKEEEEMEIEIEEED